MKKELLIKYIQKIAKQINQRFYRLEKKGKGLGESAYYYAKYETNKQKPRYTTSINKLSKMSDLELKELQLSIEAKLKSKSSTLRGLKEIKESRVQKSIDELVGQMGFEQTQAEDFRDFLENGGGYLLNQYGDSLQLIKDWLDKRKVGVSNKEFIRTYKYYLNRKRKPYDQKEVEEKFKHIISKKRKKRK